MPAVNDCPDQNDYQLLIHGELSPADVERLSRHLADCPFCSDAVQTLLGQDTLLSDLRGTPADSQGGAEVPSDLTRRLLALHSSSAFSLQLPALKPPQRPDEMGRLAHYRVLKVLGAGGMGVVFLAEDVRLHRTVALKTMNPEIAADARHRQRFLREARAAAKVEDDHIVPIYDVGEEGGVPWLAMPFLKGHSLDELLRRLMVLKPAQAVRIGAQVARGLAAAHAAGLIHRDIKPANIWIEPEGGGRARLLDFGLARDARPDREGREHLTRTGAMVGTPAFMAPEQARGKPLDARADLFSLGCVLYRAVTGRLPFRGPGTMDTLVALATQTPPAPDQVNSAVPQPLAALIMNLLAKDRSARPVSAAAVAAALEAMQEKQAGPWPVAKPVAVPAAPRRQERNPWADLTEVVEPPALASAPRRRWQRATAAALLLALGGMLAAGIIVIIKNKDGQEVARVPVPDGGSVETRKDGDSGKRVPADTNPDRRAAEWVTSIGGSVYMHRDGQQRVISAAKDLPASPFELDAVALNSNQKVDNAGLAHLKGLTHLKYLDLGNMQQVSDAGLEHLKGLANLTELRLGSTRISDAGLVHLTGLTNLTRLNLSSSQVGDAGLVHLTGLTSLTELNLANARVTDAGVVHLKGLTKLTDLNLANSRINDAGLVHLKGLTALKHLWLHDTRVDDAGLVDLKGLTNLTSLNLGMTTVTGAGLEHLKGLANLTKLGLDATRVDDAGLEYLKGLTNLTVLSLRDTPVTDAGLARLEGLTTLTVLDLGGTRISDAGLVHLKGLTNLSKLFIYRTRVGDAGLVHLKGLTKLTEVRVDRTRVTGAGLKNLVGLPLRQLYLDYARLSAGDFAAVRSDFPATQLWGEPQPSLAEDLLAEGATLLVRAGEGQEDRPVKRMADLPRKPFLVRRLDCTAVKKPLRALLSRLSQKREYEFERLEALDLSGSAIDILNFAPPLEDLQELNVSGTRVADLQPIIGLKHLRKLSLDRTPVSSLGPVAELTNLEELSLAGTPIADTALKTLENLPKLRTLDLHQTAVAGRGVGYLAKLPKLVELSLAGSKVSDLFAAEVGALTKLERLSLAGCTFSDAGLKHLAGLSNLTQLDLTGTRVTADGIATLQKALPKCKIVSGPAGK